MATLTAANSIYLLTIINLFPVPQQLQGFSTDDMWDTDAVTSAETRMGVDGYLSGGWVPTEKKQTITLQADSASNAIFDAWATAQETAREVYIAGAIVRLPGISLSYALVRGFLTSYKPMPPVKKLIEARQYGITWNSILPAPV